MAAHRLRSQYTQSATSKYVIRLMASLFAVVTMAQAQNIQNPQSAVDNLMRSSLRVDEASGAMQMQVPLGDYRGRGGASLPVTLHYSSRVWNIKYIDTIQCSGEPVSSYFGDYAHSSASGWTSSVGWFLPPQDPSWEIYDSSTQKPSHHGHPYLSLVMRIFATLPDGSRHELRRDDGLHDPAESMAGVYYAVDGSRLRYDWDTDTLFMPNGSRLMNYRFGNGALQYVDRNGNFLTFNSSGAWTDTLGRSIGVPISGVAPAAGDYTYTLPGVSGTTLTYTMRWRSLGDALSDPTQQLHYKGDSPSANCATGNHQPNNLFDSMDDQEKVLQGGIFNPVVLYQIVLPNNASYTFTYNVYGELDHIVYPTSGSETFTYGTLPPLGGQLDD